MNNCITRENILAQAVDACYEELYKRAQPSADFKKLMDQFKIDRKPFYQNYYLSSEELEYVVEKYIIAYGMEDPWDCHFDLLKDNLREGGTKDKWIPEKVDENGFKHPGYRGYEQYPSLKNQICSILESSFLSDTTINELTDKITNKVFDLINTVQNFYNHDRERNNFTYTMYLGASPNSNLESVKEYWKSQGVDIEIEERNPLLFYEEDYYGDEFEEVMIDEYGENWKELKYKEWQDEIGKKDLEREEKFKQFLNEKNNIH